MNPLVLDFYRKDKNGKNIEPLVLSESSESWGEIKKRSPSLPRGWYELSRLSLSDRIAFSLDFWQRFLPYNPAFHLFLDQFFNSLDDAGPILQEQDEGLWIAEMVYSLQDNSTFFRGLLPAEEGALDELKREIQTMLPHDYLSFLKIHNGFGKLNELGVLSSKQVPESRRRLIGDLIGAERPLMQAGRHVDPGALIPFYESSSFSFQCFFTDWYPGSEMGNVYLSGIDYTISETADRKAWADQMAFAAFLDWLAFYLEGNCLD